ncbi:hypothetical protein HanRHA438_Chr14g0645921 [Helianthus annuus]|uniref:Uncharacterized protein n=1 Tax=Helianthus annuus TaxID=4232 RepID=A0A251SG73_HELAN|nr:hypothetical protein HanXRQr2_Chr14g0635261 [Helianthus annuus]KAJ0463629.1 hypothetical protein HanHA300_Chr14g0517861 [Helianthus annuus]KAJ0485107.1 hypothetical protein HanHA89_Chr14g0564471 [Helianthus annuus]KAJ0655657.1 hypothetical protein HanLR1_Chr14g0526811 [Helianthus annuus]KAJ0659342.1 hypothetical protein HanOQP8_Chr14g0525011 [Helianthus annuus]
MTMTNHQLMHKNRLFQSGRPLIFNRSLKESSSFWRYDQQTELKVGLFLTFYSRVFFFRNKNTSY